MTQQTHKEEAQSRLSQFKSRVDENKADLQKRNSISVTHDDLV